MFCHVAIFYSIIAGYTVKKKALHDSHGWFQPPGEGIKHEYVSIAPISSMLLDGTDSYHTIFDPVCVGIVAV